MRGVSSVVGTVEGFANVEYEALFTREYARLVATLGVAWHDPEAAADAVQDAFVQAHRHWRKVSRYDDPAAWVRRVAINRLINARRGRTRQNAALPKLVMRDIDELPESSADPTEWLKYEAAYVTGACPHRLAALYATVIKIGHPEAVAIVKKLHPVP